MSKNITDLDVYFRPRSIAIIGASEVLNSFGARYLQSLLSFGYQGKLYAVNHKGEQVLGYKIHRSVLEIPDSIDLAFICVSSRFVPGILQECLEKGIGSVTVMSAGFGELGEDGRLLEEQLIQIAGQGIRIMGPNCFGVYCPRGKITTIPGDKFPKEAGGIALIAQSGQFSETIVIRSIGEGIRFSKVISYGNACNINESDLLEYLVQDEETKVITAYMEGVKDGRRFFDIIRRNSGKKPIILWKVGLTQLGSVAATSHTGSLAGEKTVWEAFFRQSHAIRVGNLEGLIDASVGFSCLPTGCGSRVALISGGGGGTVVGADACELAGLAMPPFPPEVETKLRSILPAAGISIKNPIDIGTPHPPLAILTPVLEAAASSDQIDVIMIRRIFLSVKISKLLSGSAAPSEEEQKQLMEIPVKIKEKYGKPVVIVMTEELNSVDAMELEKERRILRDYYFANGIPVYPSEQRAFAALSYLAKFRSRIEIQSSAHEIDTPIMASETTAETAFSRIKRTATTSVLSEIECKKILKQAGLDVTEATLTASREEAVAISKNLGYPVVMKIVSPQITHKSDVGGVALEIKTADEAGQAYDQIMAAVRKNKPGATIEGISVQKMAAAGVELVIGMSKDPQFGPMLMFGLGGIFIEIIQDVSFRIVPLSGEDAREMIREIKGYRLLEGYRGQGPVDVSTLEEWLLKVSRLVEENPEIMEMDINPVMVYSKGAVALDARIVLQSSTENTAKSMENACGAKKD